MQQILKKFGYGYGTSRCFSDLMFAIGQLFVFASSI